MGVWRQKRTCEIVTRRQWESIQEGSTTWLLGSIKAPLQNCNHELKVISISVTVFFRIFSAIGRELDSVRVVILLSIRRYIKEKQRYQGGHLMTDHKIQAMQKGQSKSWENSWKGGGTNRLVVLMGSKEGWSGIRGSVLER